MKSAIISGVASTRVGELPESTCMSLHADATFGAIENAGLSLSDIDGVFCAYSFVEPQIMHASAFGEYMGLRPAYATTIAMGGVTAAMLIAHAAMAVEAGVCRHALVVCGDNRLTGLRNRGGATAALASAGTNTQHEFTYGLTIPAAYALVARRYMHEFALTPEHLAAIAVNQRDYASKHPLAHMTKPLTMADVMASKPIATPLRLFDCSINSDGAAAVIVSSGETSRDIRSIPVAVLGSGQGHTHEHLIAAPSLTDFGCKESARQAFGRAGVTAADIDVAEIYDSFTITLAIELESMGFFERGEAGPAALAGELGAKGRLPCNTHGGLLSYGHPGAAGGLFHAVEAVEQLRGMCGERQIDNAKVALVHGDGGILSGHCSIVLGV